jgi:hypothetical protein
VTYALLPVATGVVATGRIGDAVAFIAVPLLLLAGERVLRRDPGFTGWRYVTSAALLLAVVTAFSPVMYLIALPALIAGTIAVRLTTTRPAEGGAIRRTLGVALVAALPLALLWPWTGIVLNHPALVLQTPGPAVPGLTDHQLHPAALLAASPGGPGTPPIWLTVPLLAAGLAGLVRVARRHAARALWGLGIVALAIGIGVAHARVGATGGSKGSLVVGWPGVPAAVIGAVLVAVALIAGDGVRERLSRMSFSWRQPFAAIVAVGALSVPVMAGVAWLSRGAAGPMDRVETSVLPAFVAAEASTGARARVLVLRPAADGSLPYALLRGEAPRLGEGDVSPTVEADRHLSTAVADLAAGRGGDAAGAVATYGVQYVLLTKTSDTAVRSVLDGTEGLSRVSTADNLDLWRVTAPAGRLVVLPIALAREAMARDAPDPKTLAKNRPVPLTAGPVGARTTVPAGTDGRLLVLAEGADSGWRAELGGQPLRRVTAWGWAQGFVLPATGGSVHIWHSAGSRHLQLLVEGLLVLVVLLAAWPAARRPTDDYTPPPVPAAVPDPRTVTVGAVSSRRGAS